MSELRFCATRIQLWCARVATVVIAAGAVGLETAAHWDLSLNGKTPGYALLAVAESLWLAWFSISLSRAYTELSPSGIRARGFFRSRDCPWSQIAKIEPLNDRGIRTIRVARRDGSGFRLAVPRLGVITPDRKFQAKADDIQRYWQENALQR